MLTTVGVAPRELERYRESVREGVIEAIREDAAKLAGARVLHINATAYGGGVAEILTSMVPLMRDLGLQCDWKVLTGSDEFFTVTKAMHNALQGKNHPWRPQDRDIWVNQNKLNAENWSDYDFVIVHDPQPAPLLYILRDSGRNPQGHFIWRCHIDLTDAQQQAWEMLRPFVEEYDGSIWTMRQYVRQGVPERHLKIAPPAIDPLSHKNEPCSEMQVKAVLDRFGVDPSRPILTQVSRFDPWKDPLGVISAYREVKAEFPDVQLILVGSMASDDPEGWEWYEKVIRRAGEDWDIKILTNMNGVGNAEVNAFQHASDVVIQKSTREGFGLTVSEALWKGRPVVGGNVGGIPLQILEGECGYLVDSSQQCAQRLAELLRDRDLRNRMGERGREHVRDHFLITRYLHDYLRMMLEVAEGSATEESAHAAPIAGAVGADAAGGA
ncbi:MAG: glycosyltransferase [Dehalococcoidia bacterium]|nr:glycosyltransferase [Dehalococcoidia bacterium]